MQDVVLRGDGQDPEATWALHQGELQFRRLLEKLPAGAYTCDPTGLITYYNPYALKVWGRAPKLNDPIDRWCGSFKLLAADGTPISHDQCWMALALKHDSEYNGEEIIVEQPDGKRRNVLAHANPIRDESGTLLGAVNVLVDITDRKQAQLELIRSEERLRQLNESLEQRVAQRTAELELRNRELQEFASVASHDLQEPLRKIHAFADLMLEEYGSVVDVQGRAYLERILIGTRRMTVLIHDLLAYSHVSMQARRYQRVDLNQVVDEVLGDLQLRIDETKGRVEVGHLPTIDADPAQMRQLLQNLIGNALKFHRPGITPVVTVNGECETSDRGQQVLRLVVRDNGIGFAQQHADRIFVPFQRLHTRTKFEGTGIGLAICRRIAERHRGTITVRSEPGKGTTFEIRLPVHHSRSTDA